MRLERLYIENFGGMHHYAMDFTPGLTVIRAPNGYGKTTLAEFIRAMFYGFPRKGKNLEKSRRQKYTPWQGGRFGGSLDFEFEGGRYRIQRSFGATPKGDIFTLLDLETGGTSRRFSENIGLELFGLDADSFERSTYMPQLRELTTDGIQAKLSDLVEDTGDLGNFEEAMGALRSARSALVPYRGSGGAVAKAKSQVSRLQMETETKTALEGKEENLSRQIRQQQDELTRVRNLQKQTQDRLDRSLLQAVTEAAHREYGALLARRETLELEQRQLESRYPMGLPDENRIEEAERMADQIAALQPRPETEAEERAARAWLEENRIFDSRLPEPKELEECRRHIAAMEAGQARLEGLQMSSDEKSRYDRLQQMERQGLLKPERLEALTRTAGKIQSLELASVGDVLTEADQARRRELMAYFAWGIPNEEEIRKNWRNLAEAARLRQEEPGKNVSGSRISNLLTVILLILGLGGIGGAIWLLTLREFLWAGLAMTAGLGLMAVGMWLFFGRRSTDRAAVQGRKRRIRALEEETEAFTGRFTDTRPLNLAMQEISRNRDGLLKLEEERKAGLARQAEASREAARLREDLSRQLGTEDVSRGILELRMAGEQLAQYRQGAEGKAAGVREALRTVEEHREAAETFLRPYFPDRGTENLHALLDELQRRMVRYAGVRKTLEARTKREAERRCLEGKLAEFFDSLALSFPREPRRALAELRDHRKGRDAMVQEEARLDREIPACRARLEEELARPLAGNREDPDMLRGEIARLKMAEEAAAEQLLRTRQQLEQLGDRLDNLSSAEAELEFWKEKLARDQKQAELLDETMACLDAAREELRNNYVGPLRRAFTGYMEKLMDEAPEKILMTADFQVRLERSGAARELGFFSAGQTDLVMLCMRLALVDALFRQEKPVVILDDPFVNLDDAHTRQALELLEELSEDRQVLYLVCNSSRDFETA